MRTAAVASADFTIQILIIDQLIFLYSVLFSVSVYYCLLFDGIEFI